MKKVVLVILADGFEEIEAVTPIDLLRRAGCEVIVAGLGKLEIVGRNNIKIKTDIELEKYTGSFDAIVLPGGAQGASNLSNSEIVQTILKKANQDKKVIAAICAAPAIVLARHGLLEGKKATGYPGFERNFSPTTIFSVDRVVKDQNILTSRGPGTALEFSIELIRELVDSKKADEIMTQTLGKV